VSAAALTVIELAPMIRELERTVVKDKSYRQYPVGQDAARFLRALRWSGAPANTLDTYETVLCRLAIDHADFESLEGFCSPVGTEYLREFLDRRWGDSALATRANRLAVLRSFFKWAVGEGRATSNPTMTIKGPRRRNSERQAYGRDIITRLVTAQPELRDQCALQLLARMGLRKNELRLLQIGHVDLTRNLITIHGKGDKVVVLPIAFAGLRDDLYLHVQGESRESGEYLLYPKDDRRRPMDPSSLHRWLKRCLENAGLPATIKTHELRHSAADDLWRVTGNLLLAQQLLRHESVETTRQYLHPTREDLAKAMRAVDDSWGEA
jgi:integrase/recombinase XerC